MQNSGLKRSATTVKGSAMPEPTTDNPLAACSEAVPPYRMPRERKRVKNPQLLQLYSWRGGEISSFRAKEKLLRGNAQNLLSRMFSRYTSLAISFAAANSAPTPPRSRIRFVGNSSSLDDVQSRYRAQWCCVRRKSKVVAITEIVLNFLNHNGH
jgi:hypothetical protein